VGNSLYARLVKEYAGYRCEICGTEGFLQRNGNPYAEAHHTEGLARTRIDNPGRMMCVSAPPATASSTTAQKRSLIKGMR